MKNITNKLLLIIMLVVATLFFQADIHAEETTENISIDIKYVEKGTDDAISGVIFQFYSDTITADGKCSGNLVGSGTSLPALMEIPLRGITENSGVCLKTVNVPEVYETINDMWIPTIGEANITVELSKTATSVGSFKVSIIDKETKKNMPDVGIKVCKTEDCKVVLFEKVGSISESNIAFDTYYLAITSVPNGYVKPKTKKFVLNADNSTFEYTIELEKQIKVPNTLSNVSKLFIICGLVGIIAGISLLYFNANTKEEI